MEKELIFQKKSTILNLKNYNQITCPCIFIMAAVFVLLQMIKCSEFLGSKWTLFTATSPIPNDLNVLIHSVDLIFHIFTVPSLEALHSKKRDKNNTYKIIS